MDIKEFTAKAKEAKAEKERKQREAMERFKAAVKAAREKNEESGS